MADNDFQDLKIVREAEAALDLLFDKFAAASLGDRFLLRPAIDQASRELLNARLTLLKNGVLTTSQDLTMLGEIKNEIDNAANAQAIVMAAIRLAGFLGAF